MSYQRMDHAAWVESNNAAANKMYAKRSTFRQRPETLTPFQARVIDIVGMVGGGIYNAPINWDKVEWKYGGGGMAVPYDDGRLSTFDFNGLSQLVFLCHEARIRCEIQARSVGRLLMTFFQRSHEGGMALRHPNLDEAVATFRVYLPPEHRIIYAAAEVTE